MTEVLATLASLSVLALVIGSMLSMGLSLTTQRIIESLKNAWSSSCRLLGSWARRPLQLPIAETHSRS